MKLLSEWCFMLSFIVVGRADLYIRPKNIRSAVGTTVSFHCATTLDRPVTWLYNNGSTRDLQLYDGGELVHSYSERFYVDDCRGRSEIDPTKRRKNGTYTLLIENIIPSDAGVYKCVDDTGIGPDRAHATLTVLILPPYIDKSFVVLYIVPSFSALLTRAIGTILYYKFKSRIATTSVTGVNMYISIFSFMLIQILHVTLTLPALVFCIPNETYDYSGYTSTFFSHNQTNLIIGMCLTFYYFPMKQYFLVLIRAGTTRDGGRKSWSKLLLVLDLLSVSCIAFWFPLTALEYHQCRLEYAIGIILAVETTLFTILLLWHLVSLILNIVRTRGRHRNPSGESNLPMLTNDDL